jgi:alpha-D-glucose phosphate-specific phosphoglucomutase
MTIKFGTEGWRAVMAEEFTAENVRAVTQAIAAHVLAQTGPSPTMVVGHDTRFLSDYFAKAACEVLAANGITALLTDRQVPTPAVSRYIVAHQLPMGIMITASHNPALYNGMKVKEAYGGSATGETVASIEQQIGKQPLKRAHYEDAAAAGHIKTVNLMPDYLKGLRDYIDLRAIKRWKAAVLVDSMHGAGGRIIEGLLKGGRCQVTTLHPEPDPLFGGQAPEPIASNLQEASKTVKKMRGDVCIANDGDADRIGIIGPDGTWLNPGQVMCVLLLHLVKSRHATGAVIKTVSNTMMINRLAADLGLELLETPVGFKYVTKRILQRDVLIGGEESGGIGLKGYLPERDGIANGLLLVEALATRRQSLTKLLGELQKKYGRWWYGRRDLHLRMEQVDGLFERLQAQAPSQMAGVAVAQVNTMDGVKLIGRDESWLLFRRSGTEPIVRVYAETPQKAALPKLLDFGVSLAKGV